MSNSAERRSPFMRLLDAFFQEENIKWVLGIGVCILLGSSVRLVTIHWQEYTPVWKYLILLGYTIAVFGLGELSYHRMGLRKTGTVLMSLTVLLIPISFLALHWIQPTSQTDSIDGLRHIGLMTLLGINLLWSTYAANHIFRHFLRGTQPTFLVCYLVLCIAGAMVPGLPTAWSPILALALWAVFAAGTVKVNRRVFWLTEEHRLPRIFGFFPILLLGSQFAAVFALGIASHVTPAWMGLICTLVSLPILLTADTVARVFEQRTGGLVRPIPWSISGPLTLGVVLSIVGVVLAMTGWPASGIVVPTAVIAAAAMGVVAHRTKQTGFVWGMIVCVIIAYQTSPVFFKELVLQLRDQAAAAVREKRLPYAFYGLTYAPLIVVFSGVAAILRRRGNALFASPIQMTATALPCLLLAVSFTHPSAIFPVGLLLCPVFAMQFILFRQQLCLIPAVVSFLSAAYGAPEFAVRVLEWDVSAQTALLVWVAANALLLLPGILIDRWTSRFKQSVDSPLNLITDKICQRFSLAGTIAAVGVWFIQFGTPSALSNSGPELLVAGCIIGLLASHTLRWLKTGLGELTLLFATYVLQMHFRTGNLSSWDDLQTLSTILLVQWVVSFALDRIPTARISRAFGAATRRISFSGLCVLFGLYSLSWIAQHFVVTDYSLPMSLLMLGWGLDASRRLKSRAMASIVWVALFANVSAVQTRWLGLELAPHWWMLAWTTTGLILAGVRRILVPTALEQGPQADESTVKTSYGNGLYSICLSPLEFLLPLLFVLIGTGSLISLGWAERISGGLALCGLLATRRGRFSLEVSQLFLPLLNWQILAALASILSGATGKVFSMSSSDLAGCGLPMAAFAAISLWCFESRIRKFVAVHELIDFHQIALLCLTGFCLNTGFPLYENPSWATDTILWAAIAWGAVICASFTRAVRTQQSAWVWQGEKALAGAFVYFILAGVVKLASNELAYALVSSGLVLWSIGRWTEMRNRLSVLSKPFVQTGYCLPFAALPLALFRQFHDVGAHWAGVNSLPILFAAAFYFWRGLKQRELVTVIFSAVMLNVAFVFLWMDLNWSDPQLFMMPVGICVLAVTELMKREIPEIYHERLRFIGALAILVSPVFHIVTGSWTHILILMVASAALALFAIGLRVRVLLYTSTSFLLADLVAMVARGSVDEPSLLWIVGVLLGGAIIALGAVCENHRETLLARLRGLAAELEQWA